MRIVVCTKRDIAGNIVLNHVLPELLGRGHQVLVLLSDKTRAAEAELPPLAEMKFYERDLPLRTVFPLLDRSGGAPRAPYATFHGLSQRHGVEIRIVGSINGPEGEGVLRAFQPDLILSARFSLIFKANIIALPRHGILNIHPGALPEYGGLFAPFRAMLNGDEAAGCTLHVIDEGIDTGPVVGIAHLPIERRRSLLWHVVNLYPLGLSMALAAIDRLDAGLPLILERQDPARHRYGTLPGLDAFEEFRRQGMKLVDPDEYMALMSHYHEPEPAGQGLVAPLLGAA